MSFEGFDRRFDSQVTPLSVPRSLNDVTRESRVVTTG
jgi:hypothetical protein